MGLDKSVSFLELQPKGSYRDPPEHCIFPVRDAASTTLNVEVCELDTVLMNPTDLVYTYILMAPVAKLVNDMDMSTLYR
ncbi:hypothetical protein PF010_g13460 [Phytophthora fragariae]|uniref:Uncharacterized protein n=1 Tax=Phytophthora fragariae TaxID=53985 RepID=A0A6A3SE04_9STRA|nr:hypothetical protein PF003_g6424 [Phytophthora fragariae]KAE8934388.1 hypothetical protein PF009_g15631 [Phytophthora fragariae]KAE9002346.1 hypothetical protein PF011_g13356 [Phytophthora fragariae]KAE9104233.1 hypothetical protein PF010_g13460 [Phytophthora fragariae]KAE9111627.1 hypothetical protein PF007_g11414 [Phytophthora fragariae]